MRGVYGTRIFHASILNSVDMQDEFKIEGFFTDENRSENLVTLCFRGR